MTKQRLSPVLFLVLVVVGCLAGCQGSNAQMSEDYKKLPPGEGERRLKATLKMRAEGKHMDHPLPADVRASGN